MTSPLPAAATCHEWIALLRSYHARDGSTDQGVLAQAGLTPLTGGRNNTVYRCERDGRMCCIKVYRTDGRRRDEREWRALTYLAAHRPGLAPRPLHHAPDDRLPMVAMEYLPGESLLTLPLSDRHLNALAVRLQQIHALTPATGGYPDAGEGSSRAILARVERWAVVGSPEVRALLGNWLASDDATLLRGCAPPVFGLSDPNLANWLWDEATGLLRRVDLEYAGWSDLASELADLVEGPWARVLPDAAWLSFAGRFANLDPARFAAARRLFALFWVGIYSERGDVRLPGQVARATQLLEDR